MIVKLRIELNDVELSELGRIEGKRFLAADEIQAALGRVVRRALGPAIITLGALAEVIYLYREDEPRVGRRHKFKRRHRPVLEWDGHGLRTRGGAYRVTEENGINPRRTPRG